MKGVREGTLSTGKSQARNPTHKQKAERFRAQYEHLGAAAGSSPARPSCIRGVPGVIGLLETPGSLLRESSIMWHCSGSGSLACVSVGRRSILPSAACRHRETSRRHSRWSCVRAQCAYRPRASVGPWQQPRYSGTSEAVPITNKSEIQKVKNQLTSKYLSID